MEVVMDFVEENLIVDVTVTIFATVLETVVMTRSNIVGRNLKLQH